MLGLTIDKFLLIGKLGVGGMGAVYLALQSALNREVALKLISGLQHSQEAFERFKREARSIAMLDHPNIVKLYDFGVAELPFPVPYMALEYVKGGCTLRARLSGVPQNSPESSLSFPEIRIIFRQVMHAMQEAHHLGIIHRDMKPENVMLREVAGNRHFVKVLDFGLAKAVSGELTGFEKDLSIAGQFLGTPQYVAPEQIPGGKAVPVDHRADLYAVALMIYEAFTRRRPYDGLSDMAVLTTKKANDHRPESLPDFARLHPSIQAFLARGLAQDPDQRFSDASEMLDSLEQAMDEIEEALGRASHQELLPTERVDYQPIDSRQPPATSSKVSPSEAGDRSGGDSRILKRQRQQRYLGWMKGAVVILGGVVLGLALARLLPTRDGPRETGTSDVPAVTESRPTSEASRQRASGSQEATTPKTEESAVGGTQEAKAEHEVMVPPPARIPPPAPAWIEVTFESDPPECEVFSEGEFLGKTPFVARFRPGSAERTFEFRKAGYVSRKVSRRPEAGVMVRAQLPRKMRNREVQTDRLR